MELRKIGRLLCLSVVLTTWVAAAAQGSVTDTFVLQGRLITQNGAPVPDGDYAMTIAFYKEIGDLGPLYLDIAAAVKVQKGMFVLTVGNKLKLDKSVFINGDAGYFGVQVGSDPELPRLALHQVPYALRAQVALNLQCSGCITTDHLDAAVLKDYAKSANLAAVATSGGYADLKNAPVLVAVNQNCEAGKLIIGLDGAGKVVCATDANNSYSGKDFAVSNQACPPGQVVAGVDGAGKVVCAADANNSYSGKDFATSNQVCPPGQVVAGIDGSGKTSCVPASAYSGKDFALANQACNAGAVVTGVDGAGKPVCAAVAAANQNCVAGSVVTGIDAAGKPVCAVVAAANQNCVAGSVVTGIDGAGKPVCAVDKNNTYTGANFALSGQACPANQVVVAIDGNGKATCAPDANNVYTGSNFALSNQPCVAGSVVTGIDVNGKAVCQPDANSGGTVKSVASGAGLTGGPVTTSGTLSIADGGVTSAMVNFNYADSASKGGAATNVACTGCIDGAKISGTAALSVASVTATTLTATTVTANTNLTVSGQNVCRADGTNCTKGGVVFTNWGRTDCPATTSVVYTGYAGGKHQTQGGGGANTQCMTSTPTWLNYNDANQDGALIYGTEYEQASYGLSGVSPFNGLQNFKAPCTVCLGTTYTNEIMIPGTAVCPGGWTLLVAGYLMGMHYTQGSSSFVCVNSNAQGIGTNGDNNGNLWYPTEAECGALPCLPYVQNREITCAVCAR